ncbi:MAG TPA: NAD(P)-dependent alcohol dehydrogenase [Acidimicrobiales bacterium]|nr:NAD(P)-dependent alcohol dehydrogenase [Acidimicrobiales bacterium]
MKAIVGTNYGGPDQLELKDMDTPRPGPTEVLVRVKASSLNPLDWHLMRAHPHVLRLQKGVRRPKQPILGVDFAGIVEEVGPDVTDRQVGDEVFGIATGSLAEYARAAIEEIASKPPDLSFEQAASLPVAGCTALQAVRDHGQLRPGQKVLVNGAAGGVGTLTVQVAKALGAEVTGVCSRANAELVESLGADSVIDYKTADFTRQGRRYDLIIEAAGNRSLSDLRRALTADGAVVLVGAADGNWIGPLARPLAGALLSKFVRHRLTFFVAKVVPGDLQFLSELVASGRLTPVVDRTYPLAAGADAMAYLEQGHARGKVLVTP